ncbi:MAG: lipoyl(octanoyl) transferase LipB [Hyphomicrobium sp.]|jgi:lipoyl(octanoyl) transferase
MMANEAQSIALAATQGLVPYATAVRVMEARASAIHLGAAPELVWLLEHPPLYTAGTSAVESDLVNAGGLPVYPAGRGGQYTYHGPGQRVAYVMLDVKRRFQGDVRAFVDALETWIITSLAAFGVKGETRKDRVGVWVVNERHGTRHEEKLAAIGIRIRHGISFHGVSLNVFPDLGHYQGIVPCGIADFGVTSLKALGSEASMKDVDNALEAAFEAIFGPVARAGDPLAFLPPAIERVSR